MISSASPAAARSFSFGDVQVNAQPPADADVLKLGYGGINDWVEKHTSFMSEMDYDNVASAYYDLKSAANHQAAGALGDANAKALFNAAEKIQNWQSQRLETDWDFQGGGTMYHHAMPRDAASLADTVGTAIAQWNLAPSGSTPDVKADELAFGKMAHGAPASDGLIPDAPAQYKKDADQEELFLSDAVGAVNALPAGPRQTLLTYIVSEAKGWSPEN